MDESRYRRPNWSARTSTRDGRRGWCGCSCVDSLASVSSGMGVATLTGEIEHVSSENKKTGGIVKKYKTYFTGLSKNTELLNVFAFLMIAVVAVYLEWKIGKRGYHLVLWSIVFSFFLYLTARLGGWVGNGLKVIVIAILSANLTSSIHTGALINPAIIYSAIETNADEISEVLEMVSLTMALSLVLLAIVFHLIKKNSPTNGYYFYASYFALLFLPVLVIAKNEYKGQEIFNNSTTKYSLLAGISGYWDANPVIYNILTYISYYNEIGKINEYNRVVPL